MMVASQPKMSLELVGVLRSLFILLFNFFLPALIQILFMEIGIRCCFFNMWVFCLNCIYLPHPSSLMMGASQPKMSLVGVRCLFAIQYFCLTCIDSIIMEIGIRCCFCMGFLVSIAFIYFIPIH